MNSLSKIIHISGEPAHWCPGCKMLHRINVNKANAVTFALWHWDWNAEAPTFYPDISISSVECHYFLKQGRLHFSVDCKHELAGMVVDLPDLPEHITEGIE